MACQQGLAFVSQEEGIFDSGSWPLHFVSLSGLVSRVIVLQDFYKNGILVAGLPQMASLEGRVPWPFIELSCPCIFIIYAF